MTTVLAPEKWNRKATLTYLKMGLDALPEPFQTQESNKLTIVYFILSAYDVMGALDSTILSKPDLSSQIIDYVYSLQVSLSPDSPDSNVCGGFRGGTNNGNPWNPSCKVTEKIEWDYGHLANTYVALAILKMMGDDFGKVNRQSIIASLKNLQLEDGSFRSIPIDSESDMRFIYCAAVVSHMLNDWSGIDIDRATRYILASQAYDGAFGQGPGLEGHGGSTYCALAALKLMGRLDDLPKRDQLIFWLTQRQVTGFQGRINKDPDTCYSWWIGASLHILDSFQFVDQKNLQSFILECQSGFGGFIKCLDSKYPDPLHTYFSICGLQMSGAEGLRELDYGIGITTRAAATRTVFD